MANNNNKECITAGCRGIKSTMLGVRMQVQQSVKWISREWLEREGEKPHSAEGMAQSSWEDCATSGKQPEKKLSWMELVLSGRLKGNSNVFGHCQNPGILSLEGFVSGTTGSIGSGRAPLSYTEKGEEQIPSSLKDCWRAWDVEPSHESWKSSSTIYYLVYREPHCTSVFPPGKWD